MIGRLLKAASYVPIYGMKPVKIFAYRTQLGWLRRLLIEITATADFMVHWLHGQNEIMKLNQKVFGGNFIFGYGVMVTDYQTQLAELPKPSMRTNHFMGISIVSGNEVFVTNSPMISLGQPLRRLAREHVDETVFTGEIAALDLPTIGSRCKFILDDWLAGEEPLDITRMRSVSTRMLVYLLQGIDVGKELSESVTAAYLRRFVELSLFRRHLPFITGLLGSERAIKRDAFYPLMRLGVTSSVIDSTLFAGMFSIGTLVIRCVGDAKRLGLGYAALDEQKRRRFVIESLRLYPTVTAVHRVVEESEEVEVAGWTLRLTPGDQVVYPLISANTDSAAFACPHEHKIDRPSDEVEKTLAWSTGPHACPARELSVLITLAILE